VSWLAQIPPQLDLLGQAHYHKIRQDHALKLLPQTQVALFLQHKRHTLSNAIHGTLFQLGSGVLIQIMLFSNNIGLQIYGLWISLADLQIHGSFTVII
jgi:hypothetical protein